MNSSGFDPSLFHDDDGRKWFVNQQWKHTTDSVGGRPRGTAFDGILAQEYDPVARRLTGPISNIFAGSPLALVEGPHLHKRNGWYYLTTAEGGTGYDHAVTMARSRSLARPLRAAPRRPTSSPPRTPPTRPCSAPATARSSRPRTARSTTPTSARARSPAPAAQPARPRDRDPEVRLEGRRLALPRTRRPGARRSRSPPPPARPSPSPSSPATTASTARRCRRTSSGCARPTPSASSP